MSVFDWDTTAANNGSSDSNINFAEGQAPSTVNDSARALMARVAHWLNMLGANVTMGGASNAYTLTSGESLSAYSANMLLAWSPNADSTGAVTLNVDAIGAKKVYMPDGTQAGSGDLDADSIYLLAYDASLDSAAGGFKIMGFPDTTLTAGDYLAVSNNLSDVANASTARSNLAAYGSGDNASFGTLTASGDVNFDSGTLFVDVSTDRVGIGTTSPAQPLEVAGRIRIDFTDCALELHDTTGDEFAIQNQNGVFKVINQTDSNRNDLQIDGDGDATFVADVTAVDFNATSDASLKENIESLPYGLTTVLAMQPRAYDWIEQKEHDIGFVAQELESIVPEVVSQKGDYKRVSYGKLVAVMAKAIQELNAKVEALENGRS